jgi:hypothetical protein
VHQLHERCGARGFAAKSVRNQLPEMFMGEGQERDLRDLSARGLDGVELAHQRMGGSDFVVAIGTDQHEVLQIRPGQQIFQQIERRRVEPLQIIEEERQWMVRPGEDADKAPENQLEMPLRVLWRKLRDRRLFSNDELQLGDDVDHEPSVRAQRVQKGGTPTAQLGIALAEKGPDKALKRLYWSNLPDAKRPRGGTSALCSSWTTADLPMPE